jgi:tetratricopeptide (TPR) repeat protein
MFRDFLFGALLICLSFAPLGRAAGTHTEDDADEVWKNLMLEGTYLATDGHDNAKAEEVFLKALHEAEHFGPEDVRVGATLNRLGMVYRDDKKNQDAESSFRKALIIFETVYGEESMDVANINFNMAGVLMKEGRAPAAMSFLQKAYQAYVRQLGEGNLKTAEAECMIGDAYRVQRLWHDAEPPLSHCAKVREENSGILDADFGEAENSLALVLQKEGKYVMADSAFKMAEKIRERIFGITSPALAETLEAHAELLKGLGREPEAEKDLKMAAAIRKLQARSK